jgi:lipopolysaccharide/colanic/teichoic acid biosynthesis glycosyltransferase
MDLSDLLSHFTHKFAEAGKERTHAYLAGGELRAASQKTNPGARGLRLFMLSGDSQAFDRYRIGLSPWTRSAAKRIFDCVCVLLALPVLVPVLLAIGAAVGLTSRGPVLFLQKRVGMNHRTFTIFKFRTLVHVSGKAHQLITTLDNQRFTPIGSFLRRWKLDELPQLANVLLGHMSLVGPRPKMPEFMMCDLPCRPGVTGVATIAFAQEAAILARIPRERLNGYNRDVVLPAKRQMDAEYLAQATFFSDLGLLIKTALCCWNSTPAKTFIAAAELESLSRNPQAMMPDPSPAVMRVPMPAVASHGPAAGQVTAV